ncbi:MAG TPA: DUF4118 domain-containing protein, partial [Chloroflexota bacterium]|nr:DUF4118 domain-containing protein [Chloroflexota bacterium]
MAFHGLRNVDWQSARWRYGVAVALTVCVTVVSLPAHTALSRAPFLLPAVAILLTAYLGGLGPGLLATLACSVFAAIIFLAPPDSSILRDWPYLTRFAFTVVGGSLASLLMGALRSARARAEHAARDNARLYQEAVAARQDALAQSQQLQAVLAGIGNGVTAQGPTGELLYANQAAAKVMGFDSVEHLLATSRDDILHRFEILDQDGQPFPLERLPGRIALQGGAPHPTLMRYRSVDQGEDHWVVVAAQPLLGPSGEVQMAINVIQDVTAEKRVEDEKAQFLSALAHDLKTPLAAIKGVSQLMLRRLQQAEKASDSWLT